MPTIHFDRFYRYEELTQLLQEVADEYPQLVRLESAGKSYEGHDIWVLTVTNFNSGDDNEKPALWVDGNIHAPEVAGSTACLHLLHELVTKYGDDREITHCLDTRAFYICPRVCPDGAELALADNPKIIRSSTRPYPFDEEPIEGLRREDIDGDGRILQMRIQDANGAWKTHPDEPRLLIRRDPTETGGTYYRLLSEGTLENYDGFTIQMQLPKERLDLNRNFPEDWRQDNEQPGAGPYPASEPEVRSVVEFIVKHPNLMGAISFHTYSGVLLRPRTSHPDDSLPMEDLKIFQKQGEKGTAVTGYPAISIFHEFRYHPKQNISGGFFWAYESMGLFTWGIEIWSPQKQAGIEEYKYIEWWREHPIEDDLKMLKWSDEVLNGEGYVNWYAFDHPQLGQVELGGWNNQYAIANPPPTLLEKEVAPFAEWLVWLLLTSPRLELLHAQAERIGSSDTYRIHLVVQNNGWLPSYVTKKALEKEVARSLVCEIELPEDATLVSGKVREELGQLEGRANLSGLFGFVSNVTADRQKAEWIIKAPTGGEVTIIARQDRSGTIRAKLLLK